jgi:hypothetical protein
MAEIKIKVNSNPQEQQLDKLGFVGDFQRTTEDFQSVRTVKELRLKYGNNNGADQKQAEELLNNNIPLLVKGINKTDDAISQVAITGNPSSESFDGNMTSILNVDAKSYTNRDGINNVVSNDIWSIAVNNEVSPLYPVVINTSIQLLSTDDPGFIWVKISLHPLTTPPVAINSFMTLTEYQGDWAILNDKVFKVLFSSVVNGVRRATLEIRDRTLYDFSILSVNQTLPAYAMESGSATSVIPPSVDILVINGATSAADYQVGNTFTISGSPHTDNNRVVTMSQLPVVDGADLRITVTTTQTLTAETSASTAKINYTDTNKPVTITLEGDYSSAFNTVLNTSGISGVSNNAAFTFAGTFQGYAIESGDTVLSFANPFPTGSNIVIGVPLADTNVTVLKSVSGLSVLTLVPNVSYGFIATNQPEIVKTAQVAKIMVLPDFTAYVLDGLFPSVDSVVIESMVATTSGIRTKAKGDNSDLSVILSKGLDGYSFEVFSSAINTDGTLVSVEKWVLPLQYTSEDIAEMNNATSLISLFVDSGVVLPSYFTANFGGSTGTATNSERIETIRDYDSVPIAAMLGSLGLDVSTYDFKFPKTIFMNMSADTYSLVQATTLAATYNVPSGRNIQLAYGMFNSLPLAFYAIKAFFEVGESGASLTEVKYGMLGYAESHLINTVLNAEELADFNKVGILSMFSLNGSFSEYKLVNNTSPYRKQPLDRANSNMLLNKLIWEVHNIEFINSGRTLNLQLFDEIHLQFVQLLSNYSEYFAYSNILDDSGASSLDALKYNKKADVLAGNYNVILELQFFNTLKKLRVEFVVS